MSFDVFEKHFSKSLQVKPDEISSECLCANLCRGRKRKVTLDNFNKCLSFFGPLESGGGQAFVDRIVKMCQMPFFHGDIEKDDAVKLLTRQKKGLLSFYFIIPSLYPSYQMIRGVVLGAFLGDQ